MPTERLRSEGARGEAAEAVAAAGAGGALLKVKPLAAKRTPSQTARRPSSLRLHRRRLRTPDGLLPPDAISPIETPLPDVYGRFPPGGPSSSTGAGARVGQCSDGCPELGCDGRDPT